VRRTDTLIVGGGPAGAACAIGLGARALVLERTAAPADALCGGFLSWNTARRLAGLGVELEELGAQPIRRVAVFAGARRSEARLPGLSFALSRRTLDRALLAAAARAGAGIERGVAVARLEEDAVLADGGRLAAARVVLATGKHDLRGARRTAPGADPAVGLRWRLPAGAALRRSIGDAVELHLFAGGYAGMAVQEDGTANLCMAVRRSLLAAAGGDPAALLARLAADEAHLGERIAAASGPIGAAQAVANVPYGWIARAASTAYRVGDQAAVIPSLAGEGIAIALASGTAAAAAIARGRDPAAAQRHFARRAAVPVRAARALWQLAERPAGAALLLRLTPWLAGAAARLSRIG
jgi:flavin-dependent dehydrogenase